MKKYSVIIIFAAGFLLMVFSCSKKNTTSTPANPQPRGLAGKVTTIAGTGEGGFIDGSAIAAKFMIPKTITVNSKGHIFVGQPITLFGNSGLIRKISGDVVTTFLGDPPFGGNANQDGVIAHFGNPEGMFITADDDIYIANKDAFRRQYITRLFNPATAITVGSAPGGLSPTIFEAGESVNNLCVNNQGTIYLSEGTKIKKLSNGILNTFAGSDIAGNNDGTGTEAKFNGIVSMCIDKDGNLFVLEVISNGRIRKITPAGVVSTITITPTITGILTGGGGDPGNICIGDNDNIYVTDPNVHRVVKITATGISSTLAGGGDNRISGDLDGTGTAVRLKFPTGIFYKDNKLYITDKGNNKIKKIE